RPLPGPLVAPLPEPVDPVRGDRLGEAGLRDQDVVSAGRDALEPGPPELPQLSLDLVPRDRVPCSLRHGEAEPRIAGLVLPLEPLEVQAERGRPPTPPVDV